MAENLERKPRAARTPGGVPVTPPDHAGDRPVDPDVLARLDALQARLDTLQGTVTVQGDTLVQVLAYVAGTSGMIQALADQIMPALKQIQEVGPGGMIASALGFGKKNKAVY